MPTKTRGTRVTQAPVSDRISELPNSIKESILMCLPTRDAARTSILSRKWRYSWCRIPQLVLDDTICNLSLFGQVTLRRKLVEILFKILSVHEGPIFKFELTITGLEGCVEIDNLIVFLSRSAVQEFTLKLRPLGERYRMPSSLFSCTSLRNLNLWACHIAPSPDFIGFCQLVSMCLYEVVISAKSLESLVAKCPMLETLILKLSDNFNYLEIVAPKLKSFLLYSPVRCVFFRNTPVLMDVYLSLDDDGTQEYVGKSVKGTNELFCGLPSLLKLKMNYYFIKSLCSGGIPTKVTTALTHLKYLTLATISLDVEDELDFLICLLRSSPNLLDIDLSVYYAEDVDEAEETSDTTINLHGVSDLTLDKLRKVKLQYINGTRVEMEFIRFVLERSPSLEEMVIQPLIDGDEIENRIAEISILKMLAKFKRASPIVEVICLDPVSDPVSE